MTIELYLYYKSFEECQNRINQADDILRPTWKDGITETYALPEKHPTKDLWALSTENKNIFSPEELAQATPKDESWNPPLIMNE